MRFVYLILICFAAPVVALRAWWRGRRDSKRYERLADRFGRPAILPRQPAIWVHAASVGEVQAAVVLVKRLLERYPRHEVVMTTMTTTGAARVKAAFPERVTHCLMPYDLPFAVRSFFDRVQPVAAIIVETELWPNVLVELKRRQVPLLIANARMSSRAAGGYRWLRPLFEAGLRGVAIVAQTDLDAERFRRLGADHVMVCGNLKFDVEIPAAMKAAGEEWRKKFQTRFVWVAGSTHEREEQAVLEAHRQLLAQDANALLVLAPRHPQRFASVKELLSQSGLRFSLRSTKDGVNPDTAVLLLDTLGELLAFYAAADLAFVGGSIAPVGGHNVLEPAAQGVAVLCGPHVQNIAVTVERLKESGGLRQVGSPAELSRAVCELAMNDAARRDIAERARAFVSANRGATSKTLELFVAKVGPV